MKAPREIETAKQAYDRNHAEATRILALLAAKLAAPTEAPDWGDVGSLAEAVVQMRRAGHCAGIPELTKK